MNNLPEDLQRAILGAEYRAKVGVTSAHDEMDELLTLYPILQQLPMDQHHPLNLLKALKMGHEELLPQIYRWRRENLK